ncbi:hypothetical protein NX059_003919 [Plenodomus lindquistii]|nr:hypothetical protein NX059_003919 [Plenodomus lindquistii]
MSSQYSVPKGVTATILDMRLQKMKLRGEDKDLTASNSRISPLLKLPGELRNKIYNYILGDLSIRFKSCNYLSVQMGWMPHALALTQVCRQVHAETRLIEKTCTELSGHISNFYPLLTISPHDLPQNTLRQEEFDKIKVVRIAVDEYQHEWHGSLGRLMHNILGVISHWYALERMVVIVDTTNSLSEWMEPKSVQVDAMLLVDRSIQSQEERALEALKRAYAALEPRRDIAIELYSKNSNGSKGAGLGPRTNGLPVRAHRSGRRSF